MLTIRQSIFLMQMPCEVCRGEGKTIKNVCSSCEGTGSEVVTVSESLSIPAGVDHDMVVRFPMKGDANGRLEVTFRVEKSPLFDREGVNIHSSIEISLPEAVLGCSKRVQTLYGEKRVDIPRGTQGGTRIKLGGSGVVGIENGVKGDHFLEVRVVTPRSPREEELQLYKRLLELAARKNT